MRVVPVIVMAACGGSPPLATVEVARSNPPPVEPAPDAGPLDAGAPDAGRRIQRTPCPARFGDPGPTCEGRDNPGLCNYPEGTCSCWSPPQCGGMARPPLYSWRCERPQPPSKPACGPDGTPCTGTTTCNLGPCNCGAQMACINGKWATRSIPCPP